MMWTWMSLVALAEPETAEPPAPVPPAPAPTAETAPTGEATETGETAPTGETAATGETPSATEPGGSAQSSAAAGRFEAERLVREPTPNGSGWIVRSGSGTPMNSAQLLAAFDDPQVELVFLREQRRMLTNGLVAGALGSTLLVTGLALIDPGLDEPPLLVGAAGGLAGGVVFDVIAVSQLARRGKRAKDPSSVWSTAEVDARIRVHNNRLAEELGTAP